MRFLLSRGFVLLIIVALLAVVALSFAVPQSFAVPAPLLEKWRHGHPRALPAVDLLGLHHVFTTGWFALIAALFVLALALSCVRQFQSARRLTFSLSDRGEPLSSSATYALGREVLLRHGYRKIASDDSGEKFVRHPWGHWGNFLFHLGMVLVAGAVLVLVLTQQRGMFRMEEGALLSPEYPWFAEDHGLLAGPLRLPAPVRMDKFCVDLWENDDTKEIRSRIAFVEPGTTPVSLDLSINHPARHGSLRIYQEVQSGHFFRLAFVDPSGRVFRHTLTFLLPAKRDRASYNEFRLPGLPFELKGKYFADVGRRGLQGGSPLLVLRFYDGERVMGETRLQQGESGRLGAYRVTLESSSRWAGVLFTEGRGIAGIFLGFFVIIAGGLLHYFTVPREAFVRRRQGEPISWRAARFEELYREEREAILRDLDRGGSGG